MCTERGRPCLDSTRVPKRRHYAIFPGPKFALAFILYIMVSKRFVQMVFPFFVEEAKRKAELEELALSAEQDEEDVFDFGGMR